MKPKALLVYPTHENCREVWGPYVERGIHALCYPSRTTTGTEHLSPNCWNSQADEAENMGFPVTKAVCPTCPEKRRCALQGYLGQLQAVKEADIAICTHKRAEYSGFEDLTAGRHYISIHENPIDILRPKTAASEADLVQVQIVLHRLLNEPSSLDWFGDAVRMDDEGNLYRDEEVAVRKDRLFDFCSFLADLVDDLLARLHVAETTTEWVPTTTRKRPSGIERTLFRGTRAAKVTLNGQPWRFVLSAAAGELVSGAVLVSQRHETGDQDVPTLLKTAIGFRDNRPSRSASTWFNDATLSADTLEAVLRCEVQNKTPGGRLELQKKAVQILRDITRSTSPRIFANIVRGVLADRPQFSRIGLICHRPHVAALQTLEPEFARRIAKVAYFGSGEDRSSNAWHQMCDLIVVAGTPRVPPSTIATYLVQIGDVGAACREPKWGTVKWDGRTESGEPVTVSARGYHDEAWRRAHRDHVRASIVQAIGRGRGILETGCEVVVLSTEECGLVISDSGLQALNGSSARVLAALQELCAEIPNKYFLENAAHKSTSVAAKAGLSVRQTQDILGDLERRGLVLRRGERGGWLPTDGMCLTETEAPSSDSDEVPPCP